VGLLCIDQPELDGERERLLRAFPRTRSRISFVCRMNRDNVRNLARRIVRALEDQGIRAMVPAMGFPA
jgi:hypothetical protein